MPLDARLKTFLKYLLVVAVGVTPALVFYVWQPAPVYGLYLYLAGSSSGTLSETIHAVDHTKELHRSIVDYWKRCTLRKDEGRLRLIETPGGAYWLPASCGPMCLMAEQTPDEYGKVRAGDIVLDCGANIGAFARRALDSGASRVIAIEPAPENLECLRRNLQPEIAQGRVVIVDKGVWDSEKTLELTTDKGNSAENSLVLRPGDPAAVIRIPVTTIDKIVHDLGLARVDMIKMDIEGSEKQALRGASRTIAAFKPRLGIATEHLPDDETAIPALIRSFRQDYSISPSGPKIIIPATGRVGTEILLFR